MIEFMYGILVGILVGIAMGIGMFYKRGVKND